MKRGVVVLGLVALVMLALQVPTVQTGFKMAASVFFVDSSTPQSLHDKYAAAQQGGGPRVRLLIVPGHDSVQSGTYYRGLSEADLTVATGEKLKALFANDRYIQADITRTAAGYTKTFADYFAAQRQAILDFRSQQYALMSRYQATGQVTAEVVVDHNVAPADTAIKLYGINKWANENAVDVTVHIHYNDIPRKDRSKPGPWEGFAIYVPEHQFSNAKGAMAVAQAIAARLKAAGYHPSTLPGESTGIIEEQGLIAIGSNNSADSAAILIEYAYVYEPFMQTAFGREQAMSDFALQTYLGLQDFFGGKTISYNK